MNGSFYFKEPRVLDEKKKRGSEKNGMKFFPQLGP